MKRKITIASSALIVVLLLTACAPGTYSLPFLNSNTNTATQSAPAATQAPTSASVANTSSAAAPVVPSTDASAVAALQGTLTDIYNKVGPSVVSIEVTKQVTTSQSLPFDFFGNNQGNNNSTQVEQALGSGFVWDKQGNIVTNNHVVSGATDITVKFSDGSTTSATLVGADPDSDLAVIKVNVSTDKLVPVSVANSDNVQVGQLAIAIGNPYGEEGTMTMGIISALGRSLPTDNTANSTTGANYTIPDVIQTDAPINPGNSGGVLLNDQGQVVGVTSAIESNSNSSAGIGFVIPSNIVTRVVPSLISDGTYVHPWLGIEGTDLTSELAKAMNLPDNTQGALVISVTPGGPADSAGVKGGSQTATIQGQQVQVGGDVITAINGQPVTTFDDIVSYLASNGTVGQQMSLTVLRNGNSQTLDITLGSRPSSTNQQTQTSTTAPSLTQGGYLGISGATVTPDIASAMGLGNNQSGVLVVSVQSGSPAADAGLQAGTKTVTINGSSINVGGDIITAIDNQSIQSIQGLRQALAEYYPGDVATLTIIRNGQSMNVGVTLGSMP